MAWVWDDDIADLLLLCWMQVCLVLGFDWSLLILHSVLEGLVGFRWICCLSGLLGDAKMFVH